MEELFDFPIMKSGVDELVADIIKSNYDNRRLIINDEINNNLLESICLYILKYNQEDKDVPEDKRKPIWIILNSVGGVVNFGMGLIDCIKHSITPVYCLIIGMAASMASYIPSQICLQARFPKDSEEYKVLDYRILCGQLFQQNSIDKAKGIIAKPMPKHWYDNSYNRIEETDTPEEISKKEFNQRICADKKPYFFIYNYPTLMKEYKDYIKTSDAVSRSRFNIPLEELLSSQELTEEQAEFLKFYKEFYPVNAETCVVNELCWEIEKTLADVKESKVPFDSSILKSDATYTNKDKAFIKRIYDKYNKTYANRMSRHSSVYEDTSLTPIGMTFESECAEYVPDAEKLCNILVDLGYNTKKGKTFVWEMSGDTIIDNLLSRTDGYAQFPVKDPDGDIEFCGEHFSMKKVKMKGEE